MANIAKPNTFTANTAIEPAEVNDNFDTIYNEFNGGISASNLATDAVTTAKIAAANVTTAKIADDAVTAGKIDFGGAGVGVWWEEIGRTTLSGAGDTITVSGLPARKYLKLVWSITATGAAGGNITFNSDTGANYAYRYELNGAAGVSAVSQTSIGAIYNATSLTGFGYAELINISTAPKQGRIQSIYSNSTAGTAIDSVNFWFKWVNTSAQISSVTITNAGAGDYAIGSELIVLGHD